MPNPKDAINTQIATAQQVAVEIKDEAAYDASVLADDIDSGLDAIDAAIARHDERADASLDALETRMYEVDDAVDAAATETRRRAKAASDALRGR